MKLDAGVLVHSAGGRATQPRSRGLPRSGLGPPLTAGSEALQTRRARFTGLLGVWLQPLLDG